MSAFKENTLEKWPWWRWTLTVLNIIALVLSIILSWHYFTGGSIVGCDGTSACEQVLSSQWSMIAGKVPVIGLAMGVYLAIFIAGFYITPATEASERRMAWTVLLVFAGSVFCMAIWFFIVQKWIIGAFCPYCMAAHITGMFMAVIIIWRANRESGGDGTLRTIGLTGSGLLLAVIIVASQLIFVPKAVNQNGVSQNTLPDINYREAPLVGSPEAPYKVKILFDYQCLHCQKIHSMLNDVVRRYNGKLAFALCPTPLNAQCNPYIPQGVDAYKNSCQLAKIGLAVWLSNRDAYQAFDNWMFSVESGKVWHPRSLESTAAKATELIGRARLDVALSSPWIDQYMQTCIGLFGATLRTGRGGIPKLIFGSRWVIPQPGNADDLVNILQKTLAVPKPYFK
jgi:uncharacterized membrane protein